jgi:AcrR family transcriptional regulator
MEGRPGLRELKKQQTRERLTAAAFRLLRERGYQGATVELIAEEAEVSVTTFFRYYESKEDVFLEAHRAIVDRVEAAIRERPPGVSVIDALREVAGQVVDELPEDLWGEDIHKEIDAVPELRDRMRDHENRILTAIMKAYGKQLGLPPTDLRPRLIAGAIITAFDAAWAEWADEPGAVPLRDRMDEACDLVERMTAPLLLKEPAGPK